MPPAQLGRSAIGFSPAKPAVCRCSIETAAFAKAQAAAGARLRRSLPGSVRSRDCRSWAGPRLGPGLPAPRSQAQLLADLGAVKASLLELTDEHAGVLGRQLKTPVGRHRNRRARTAEAPVARRAARQLLEVVGEQPADQRALRECHRSAACQGCAPRPARRGRRRMPPRRSRPSPPRPRPARLRRRSPPSGTVLVTSRSQCVLTAGALEPVDAAPAARPSHAAARRRRRRNRAHRGRGTASLSSPPATGGVGGPSEWVDLGPPHRAGQVPGRQPA